MHGYKEAATLTLDADSFRSAAQLTSLAFTSARRLVLMPDCLMGLTALVRLTIYDCGLASIPSALEALGGSLTRLALPYNDAMQLAHNDVTVLLALRRLRMLDLRKTNALDLLDDNEDLEQAAGQVANAVVAKLHFEPSTWSNLHVQQFAELAASFALEHGRKLALQTAWTVTDEAEDEDNISGAYWSTLGDLH